MIQLAGLRVEVFYKKIPRAYQIADIQSYMFYFQRSVLPLEKSFALSTPYEIVYIIIPYTESTAIIAPRTNKNLANESLLFG